ncbi:MAG TPA: MaoC family dehydratase N-terminal domain-containing protein [Ilumatobacter sp.]|nr:MaoC family dehydratase N-terminal domain-containing protein [Ilumatobacter sp.]
MTDLAALVGAERQGASLLITRSRLRLFAKATGQTDPIFVDVAAARAAGHPDLPAPPTFYFSVDLEAPDPFEWLLEAGVDLGAVLHGEQSFTYHRVAHAGDELRTSSTIVDHFTKKEGALEFVVTESRIEDTEGCPVATMRQSAVIRRAA